MCAIKKINIQKPVVESFCAHRSAAGCHFWTSSISSALGCLTHTQACARTHIHATTHSHTQRDYKPCTQTLTEKKQTSIALLLLTFQFPTVLSWSRFSPVKCTHIHSHTLSHTLKGNWEKYVCVRRRFQNAIPSVESFKSAFRSPLIASWHSLSFTGSNTHTHKKNRTNCTDTGWKRGLFRSQPSSHADKGAMSFYNQRSLIPKLQIQNKTRHLHTDKTTDLLPVR